MDLCLKTALFGLLCVSNLQTFALAADKLQGLREAIRQNDITSKTVSDNCSTVKINGRKYIVYVYDTKDSNTLNNVITCINCEFGTWTAKELLKFLKPFPSKNQASFARDRSNTFGAHRGEMVKILNRIAGYTERFIRILLNFMHMTSNDTTFDADLLRAFIRLNFKIDHIKTLGNARKTFGDNDDGKKDEKNKGPTTVEDDEIRYFGYVEKDDFDDFDSATAESGGGDDDDDDVVVRLISESINAIRGFLTLNCTYLHPFYADNQRNVDPKDHLNPTKYYGINEFLEDIKILKLEPPAYCGVRDTLFLESGKRLWTGVEWKTKSGWVSVEEIIKNIGGCHDLETILWYQELVFKTIIKIVLVKARTFDVAFPEDVVDRFKAFYTELVLDFKDLPADVIDIFFTFFYYDPDGHPGLMTKIDKYVDSASDVRLGERVQNPLLGLKLAQIIDRIMNKVDSVRCFIRLYDFLRREDRKSNLPFAKGPKKIDYLMRNAAAKRTANYFQRAIGRVDRFSIEQEEYVKNKYQCANECKYVRGLFHICFLSLVALNNALGVDLDRYRDYFYSKAFLYLKKVHGYLEFLLSNNYYCRINFNLVYRVLPLIEIHVLRTTSDRNYHNLIRLVNAVLVEFNEYWLQYCHPPEFNVLFLQNINFAKLGQLEWVYKDIANATNNMNAIENQKSCTHLYRGVLNFDNINSVFVSYDDIIKFNWKSEKKGIGFIYNNFVSVVSNLSYVYGFYEYYLRFFLAMTYYEMKLAYDYLHLVDKNDRIISVPFIDYLNSIKNDYIFPENYRSLVIEIHHFSTTLLRNTTTKNYEVDIPKVHNEAQLIEDCFEHFGVYIKPIDDDTLRNMKKSLLDIFNQIRPLYDMVTEIKNAGKHFEELLSRH